MVTVRAEKPEDVDHIRRVNDEAFGQENESKLIGKLPYVSPAYGCRDSLYSQGGSPVGR